MANRPCPFTIQNLIKTTMFKLMALTILWCMTLIIGPLTQFGLLFPVVCFVFVSGQAL